MRRTAKTALIASIAALALGGCATGAPTQHNAVWSADDEATFLDACHQGQTASFCECALQAVEAEYPRPSALPGGKTTPDDVTDESAGTTAAQHPGDIPGC